MQGHTMNRNLRNFIARVIVETGLLPETNMPQNLKEETHGHIVMAGGIVFSFFWLSWEVTAQPHGDLARWVEK